ncbi:histidinol-phosphatase [Propylenella binzhouense]|uniref:Histidinol-phosphatase n=1 Tax=Propylenella binzhouense TaxID=2555902 RepID=A0A964WT89_9HYPH|nr:histidinol-phosphatase [Propylenella binzhouense]MYZ47691.1 histidinol-phosphatase [Propylenella binzhouense]
MTPDFLPFLHELADAAGRAILPHFRAELAVENKAEAGFDPVTIADRAAEAAMREMISRRFPDHGVIGEEYGPERTDAEFVWVLDPVDGTRAFISGLPLWGVLIGLKRAGEPMLGMVAQPYIGERFYGTGSEAWFERGSLRKPLRVRSCPGLSAATLSATSPTMFTAAERAQFGRLEREARLVRYGYDCYAYAMVAAGFVDCVVESGLGPYDIEPIVPIILGAGGRVTDWAGVPKRGGGQVLATGDARVHAAALARLAAAPV